MAIINKVTTLRAAEGSAISDETIQTHFDTQNTDGWRLVGVDNLVGWYRFFWEKTTE